MVELMEGIAGPFDLETDGSRRSSPPPNVRFLPCSIPDIPSLKCGKQKSKEISVLGFIALENSMIVEVPSIRPR